MLLLIPSPKCPTIGIDVYLDPLIEELKELWKDRVYTYDARSQQNFKLHEIIM